MFRIKYLVLAALASAHFILPASAQSDRVTLFQHKAWTVSHELSPDTGRQLCTAETFTRDNRDLFMLRLYSNGAVEIALVSNTSLWNSAFEDDLLLDIDYSKWNMNNARFDVTKSGYARVRFEFANHDTAVDFLAQLYDGSAVALKDARGDRSLITWSLAGSAAALLKLGDCGKMVRGSAESGYGSGYGSGHGSGANTSGYGTH